MSENHIGDTIFSLLPHMLPDHASDSQYKEFIRKKMADYIRGVFEYGAAYRSLQPPLQASVGLSSASNIRINNILSLNKARHLDLDYIASFNAMDTMHIITACGSGNVHTVSFPAYGKDVGVFSKEVEVELTEIKAGSGAAGFHFSHR
ncbi:hypothetical protein F5887DRAFT_921581 [Amanita rubescens]|nr:hypothetical protein F5887DRAFT_921581 [Amanita rubescens]